MTIAVSPRTAQVAVAVPVRMIIERSPDMPGVVGRRPLSRQGPDMGRRQRVCGYFHSLTVDRPGACLTRECGCSPGCCLGGGHDRRPSACGIGGSDARREQQYRAQQTSEACGWCLLRASPSSRPASYAGQPWPSCCAAMAIHVVACGSTPVVVFASARSPAGRCCSCDLCTDDLTFAASTGVAVAVTLTRQRLLSHFRRRSASFRGR